MQRAICEIAQHQQILGPTCSGAHVQIYTAQGAGPNSALVRDFSNNVSNICPIDFRPTCFFKMTPLRPDHNMHSSQEHPCGCKNIKCRLKHVDTVVIWATSLIFQRWVWWRWNPPQAHFSHSHQQGWSFCASTHNTAYKMTRGIGKTQTQVKTEQEEQTSCTPSYKLLQICP